MKSDPEEDFKKVATFVLTVIGITVAVLGIVIILVAAGNVQVTVR